MRYFREGVRFRGKEKKQESILPDVEAGEESRAAYYCLFILGYSQVLPPAPTPLTHNLRGRRRTATRPSSRPSQNIQTRQPDHGGHPPARAQRNAARSTPSTCGARTSPSGGSAGSRHNARSACARGAGGCAAGAAGCAGVVQSEGRASLYIVFVNNESITEQGASVEEIKRKTERLVLDS
ncbi:hypothetical protein C8R44DRAFT_733175 [Mycena epipterygia]|nr:hypothetical protein C8R44DRAFT_733175 [Mycena epipterygia]